MIGIINYGLGNINAYYNIYKEYDINLKILSNYKDINSNIDKWQSYYYNNGIVHYQYYGEQNFVYDTVIENGGKVTTMPEKWYGKHKINEDTKIIHHAGVDK